MALVMPAASTYFFTVFWTERFVSCFVFAHPRGEDGLRSRGGEGEAAFCEQET